MNSLAYPVWIYLSLSPFHALLPHMSVFANEITKYLNTWWIFLVFSSTPQLLESCYFVQTYVKFRGVQSVSETIFPNYFKCSETRKSLMTPNIFDSLKPYKFQEKETEAEKADSWCLECQWFIAWCLLNLQVQTCAALASRSPLREREGEERMKKHLKRGLSSHELSAGLSKQVAEDLTPLQCRQYCHHGPGMGAEQSLFW